MKEYIIITKTNLIDTLSKPSVPGYSASSSINFVNPKPRTFKTLEAAIDFANTLDYGVTIYEAVAKTKIKHELTKLNENTNRSSRKQGRVS